MTTRGDEMVCRVSHIFYDGSSILKYLYTLLQPSAFLGGAFHLMPNAIFGHIHGVVGMVFLVVRVSTSTSHIEFSVVISHEVGIFTEGPIAFDRRLVGHQPRSLSIVAVLQCRRNGRSPIAVRISTGRNDLIVFSNIILLRIGDVVF